MTDEKTEYKKCSRKDGAICSTLNDRAMISNRAKGLRVAMGMDTRSKVGDAKISIIAVAYHQTAAGQGMLLNFCPWCGQDIQFWRSEDDKGVEA